MQLHYIPQSNQIQSCTVTIAPTYLLISPNSLVLQNLNLIKLVLSILDKVLTQNIRLSSPDPFCQGVRASWAVSRKFSFITIFAGSLPPISRSKNSSHPNNDVLSSLVLPISSAGVRVTPLLSRGSKKFSASTSPTSLCATFGFEPRNVYKTSTEKQWLQEQLPSVQEFWLDSIKAELKDLRDKITPLFYWAQNDPNHEVYPRNKFGIYVPKTDIYKSYVDWYGPTKESKMVAENEFYKQTWGALGGCIEEERKTTSGNRLTSVRLTPDSANLKKALVEASGQPYLFDNIDAMDISKDPLNNSALDIQRKDVFNLSQISIPPEKRPMAAPVDQRKVQFQDYSKGSPFIQAVSSILNVD
ncbi:hypothetical protein PROFUN_13640 [Planoprotostelium fungivorum]|uniref:Uncharacterized protein n=1 Tax=Planoprotostelium fungivorum TaxID=1890364 RepID=A0A2P6N3F7_9EUKA|nr:hypothetical protein PROFUN_13640 [Planoprotostelium fungivorum]